jgi:hypothetical protein
MWAVCGRELAAAGARVTTARWLDSFGDGSRSYASGSSGLWLGPPDCESGGKWKMEFWPTETADPVAVLKGGGAAAGAGPG